MHLKVPSYVQTPRRRDYPETRQESKHPNVRFYDLTAALFEINSDVTKYLQPGDDFNV